MSNPSQTPRRSVLVPFVFLFMGVSFALSLISLSTGVVVVGTTAIVVALIAATLAILSLRE